MDRRRLLIPALMALAAAVLAAPASAVVGGRAVSPKAVPWFAKTGLCGGTLIAPDRVATAAHCVDPVDLSELDRITVGGEVRRAIRVALPSTWRRQRTGFALDDVAIVALDRPVRSVRPVRLAAAGRKAATRVRVVGRGQVKAPPPGRRAAAGLFEEREATLETIADRDCDRRFARSGSVYSDHFEAGLMLCAIDANGREPLDSVCNGDSGGPMVSGPKARPVLEGVISWTGERCGADGLPSVVADVRRYRDFLTAAEPAWAPVPAGPPRIAGEARPGGTLACEPPEWEVAPDEVEYRWLRRVRGEEAFELEPVGKGQTYVAVAKDAGRLLECQALGSNAGGRAQAPAGPQSTVRVAD